LKLIWTAFAALCLLFLGANATWLRQDRSPPGWDDAFYLSHSLRLWDALTTGGLPAYGTQFLTGMREKPPLIAALPTPAYLILGRKPRAALTVNLACLLILFVTLFRLGWEYASPRAGLVAVWIAGTMPMIYGLSHWYLVECALTAIVCLTISLPAVLAFDMAMAAVLGVLCACGVLMKFSFPLYVALPLAFLLRRRLSTKLLAAFLLPFAAIAAPWYILNFGKGLHTALRAGSGDTARIYQTGAVLSLADIGRYLLDVANCGPTVYFVVLGLALATCLRFASKNARCGLLLCALWGTPLMFLACGHYRDLRYAAPLFPAVALGLGILLDGAMARYRIAGVAATCVVLGLGAVSMMQTSFGVPGKRPIELGGLLFVQPRFNYASRADGKVWPYRDVLQELYQGAKWKGGERKRLVVGNDTEHFNLDNLGLEARSGNLPFDGAATAYETDPRRLRETLAAASYFLYKDGSEKESPFNRLGAEAIAAVRADANFAETGTRLLPDGSLLHLFENNHAGRVREMREFLAPGFDSVPDCSVTFDGKLGLSGLSTRKTGRTIEVRYRWRCLKPVQGNYWCFTHILDEQGNIVGYLDHPVMKGDPPTSQWTQGSIAIEQLQFTLPEMSKEGAYRLRLGLFCKESGDRLPITASGFPLADSGTAAVSPLAK
jgi:hypothetical protein